LRIETIPEIRVADASSVPWLGEVLLNDDCFGRTTSSSNSLVSPPWSYHQLGRIPFKHFPEVSLCRALRRKQQLLENRHSLSSLTRSFEVGIDSSARCVSINLACIFSLYFHNFGFIVAQLPSSTLFREFADGCTGNVDLGRSSLSSISGSAISLLTHGQLCTALMSVVSSA
jgi:hypothetical protein